MGWWFGYYPYDNPYATSQVVYTSSYDYSEPLIVYADSPESDAVGLSSTAYSEPASSEAVPDVSSPALQAFDSARQSFNAGKYEDALKQVDEAIGDMPRDAVLHEFRALTLFALGKYQDCAATLYAVLSAGPGWDWTTMSGLYPSVDVYTTQLRALEQFQRDQPDDPAGHLILAYHYLTAGHTDEAMDQLKILDRLTPNDPVVRSLRLQIDPDAEVTVEEKQSVPPLEANLVKKADVLGEWTATRDDGSTFGLKLTDDDQFAWTYSVGNTSQTISGSYALDEESVLTMDTGDSGMMFAQLVPEESGFKFYLLGDTQGQEPLSFNRSL